MDNSTTNMTPPLIPFAAVADADIALEFATRWDNLEAQESRWLIQILGQLPQGIQVTRARLALLSGYNGSQLDIGLNESLVAGFIEADDKRLMLPVSIYALATHKTTADKQDTFLRHVATNVASAHVDAATLFRHVRERSVEALIGDVDIVIGLLGKLSLRVLVNSPGLRQIKFNLQTIKQLLRENADAWDALAPEDEAVFLQTCHLYAAFNGMPALADSAVESMVALNASHFRVHWRVKPAKKDGNRMRGAHSGPVASVTISSDGAWGSTIGKADKLVKVWRMADGRNLHTYQGHAADLTSLSISADARRIVTGDKAGEVRVWDVGLVDDLPVGQPAGSTPNDLLFSTSENGSLEAWSRHTKKRVSSCQLPTPLAAFAVSADANLLAGDIDGSLMMLALWEP